MNLLNLAPSKQTQLFKHDNIFLKIVDLYEKDNLPNKIILSGSKGIGKATFAYHLINYIFSKNEKLNYDTQRFKINDVNSSYKMILNNSHPNFHLIDIKNDKNVIEVIQIRKMIDYANKSSFNNKEKIVLIDNVELLNLNSLNALLKIVEEPNDNLFFILVFNSNKKISSTLKSRCVKFNLSLSSKDSRLVTEKILKKKINDLINDVFLNYYSTPGDIISLINFSLLSKIDLVNIDLKEFILNVIDNKLYKKDDYIKNNFFTFIQLYFFNLILLDSSNNINFIYRNFVKKFNDIKKFNLDEEALFIEFKSKIING